MQTPTLLGDTKVIKALKEDIAAAARCDAKVLITGESGAGKGALVHDKASLALLSGPDQAAIPDR